MTATDPDAALRGHYLEFLGHPDGTWQYAEPDYGVDVFPDCPWDGARTLATRGLSLLPDASTVSGTVAHELVISAWSRVDEPNLVALLAVVANRAAEHGHLHPGDVLGPSGPIVDGATMEALLVAAPGYHSPGLAALDGDGFRASIWALVPLAADEATWIRRHGHDAFLELVAEQDPDLLDLARRPIMLPTSPADCGI